MAAKPTRERTAPVVRTVVPRAAELAGSAQILPELVHRKVKSQTMPRSSLEAFDALWRAYGEGRLDRALDLVAEDCEITFADGTTALRGHDGVRELLAAERRDWKTITITYDEVREARPGCVLGVGNLTASSANGEAEIDCQVSFVAEFADGRLVRGRTFRDRDAAIAYIDEVS
jgi:ketosteroid isomerase-like protein